MPHVRRILTAACGTAAALCCVLPGAASAALVPPAPCSISTVTQPFLQWGDNGSYELVAGGDFEGSLAGWTLGAATIAPGSETFGATGSNGQASLEIPQGTVVTAPPVCVNLPHPDARLFARSDVKGANLKVYALYSNQGNDPNQHVVRIPAGGDVKPTSAWQPSAPLGINPVVIPALHGQGTALITLQFKVDTGPVYIDDVFVDPWRSG